MCEFKTNSKKSLIQHNAHGNFVMPGRLQWCGICQYVKGEITEVGSKCLRAKVVIYYVLRKM